MPMKFHNYYTYIMTNPEKTVLYTGVTNDLDQGFVSFRAVGEESEGVARTGKYF